MTNFLVHINISRCKIISHSFKLKMMLVLKPIRQFIILSKSDSLILRTFRLKFELCEAKSKQTYEKNESRSITPELAKQIEKDFRNWTKAKEAQKKLQIEQDLKGDNELKKTN